MKNPSILLILVLLTSCTSVKVQEIDPSLQISHVCIEENSKVIVQEFIPVVRRGFDRHGITTEVYQGTKPRYCEYHLTYTALKTWDISMYMHHAELQLYRGNEQIAYAEYHLTGGGGLALNKWASVESKMDPVIDQLLSGYSPEIVNAYREDIPENSAPSIGGESTKAERLRELKGWFDEGLITKQEYNTEKQKVLSHNHSITVT